MWSMVLASLVLLVSCDEEGDAAKQAGAKAAAAPPPPLVVVASVEAKDVAIEREYVARTEAERSVEIRARVEAVLQKMHFVEGKPVEDQQLLYSLDDRSYQASLAAANAKLAKAKADLKLAEEQVSVRVAEANLAEAEAERGKAQQDVARLEPLAKQQAVPQQDLDTAVAALLVAEASVLASAAVLKNAEIVEEVSKLQAAAAVAAAEAEIAQAALDVEYCTLKAPMAGLIGRTLVSTGNLVGRSESTMLAILDSTDPMLVIFAISEVELIELQRRLIGSEDTERKPLEMELVLADDSVYEHRGHFRTAERSIELATGTMQVVATFPNPDGLLRPGLFARVRTSTETKKNAVLVPQRAVIEQQGIRSVYIIDKEGKATLRSIRTTNRWKEFFLVEDGIQAGDRIVIEGQQKVRPGQPVQIATGAQIEKPTTGKPTTGKPTTNAAPSPK